MSDRLTPAAGGLFLGAPAREDRGVRYLMNLREAFREMMEPELPAWWTRLHDRFDDDIDRLLGEGS